MALTYPTKKQFFYLFIATFAIRAFIFQFYIQHEQRYRQADSMDYHNCALGFVFGTGMHRADNLKPIFWRTPGYPVLLGTVYKLCGMQASRFEHNQFAQKLFLWIQIFICSFTPLLLFYLALSLTASLLIAYILALIVMVHPGFILSSMYMLTEGIAIMLFYLFLIFFYKSFTAYGEQQKKHAFWIHSIIYAAVSLAAYTWMRPMGEFVSVIALLLLFTTAADSWTLKCKKIGLFFIMFSACLMPWYIRNYKLTGYWFFCPMTGAYLNSFTVPKIVRTLNNFTLKKSIGICYYLANKEIEKEEARAQISGHAVPKELIAGRVAWPIMRAHPFLALKEWVQEVIKTTLDLYSCQITALCTDSFMYDPLEEFLLTKVADTVWCQSMPCILHIIVYLELVLTILMWIGLCAGFWQFMIKPFFKKFKLAQSTAHLSGLWLKIAPLIWAILFMTGGFGYARLRLPIEPLMIILALTWWNHK